MHRAILAAVLLTVCSAVHVIPEGGYLKRPIRVRHRDRKNDALFTPVGRAGFLEWRSYADKLFGHFLTNFC